MQFNDGQLLARFLQNQDESAFEDLVKRHATMVMTACRMVLKDGRDAEEAFQDTFTVLALKAHQHTGKESINGWLYRVAVWKALNIRSKRSVQARHIVEQKDAEMIAEQELGSATALESMKGLLAEELNRLADKYSLPLILCYLEGKTPDEASAKLGMNHNTFRIRLMRGRELLRKRLVWRGVTVSAGTLTTILLEQSAKAAAMVSEVLIQSTVKAAMASLSAVTTAGILAGGLKGVLLVMTIKKTVAIIGGLVLLGLAGSIFYLSKPVQISAPVQESKPVARENQKLPAVNSERTPELSETLTAQTGLAEKTGNAKKEKLLASAKDYYKRFKEAINAQGDERWKILRELGIELTDAEFETAWQKAQKDGRFKETKHLMGLPEFNGEEVALFLKLQDAIFSQWVANDPLAVIEWARKLPEGKNYYVSFDKERILPEWETFPRNKEGFVVALIALWAKKDMEAATRWVNEQSVGKNHETAILGLTVAMSDKNAKEAYEFIEKENLLYKEFQLYPVMAYIFSNWALANPYEAVNYLMALSSDNFETGLIKEWGKAAVGYQWAKMDLKSALEWGEKLSDSERNRFMGGIIDKWVREDLPAARDYVTAMWEKQDSENNYGMLWSLTEVWLEKDSQACAEWAMQLTDKYDPKKRIPRTGYGHKENICCFICQGWAMKDYEAAFNWIENLPPDKLKDEMWKAAVGGLIAGMYHDNELTSLKEGVDLIEGNIPQQYRRGAYQNLITAWTQAYSPSEAMAWIHTLPDGEEKDMLISICVQSRQASYLDRLRWASGIQNTKYRNEISEHVFNEWVHVDPTTARQWLQDSVLPQSVKDKWLAGK